MYIDTIGIRTCIQRGVNLINGYPFQRNLCRGHLILSLNKNNIFNNKSLMTGNS